MNFLFKYSFILLAISTFLGSCKSGKQTGSELPIPAVETASRVVTFNNKVLPGKGVYSGVAIWTVENNINLLSNYESLVGVKQNLVMWFHHWADADSSFNLEACNNISARAAIPYLSWCPASDNSNINQPAYKLTNITTGNFDGYITRFAKDCKNYGKPLFLRFAFEMNGENFLPWSGNTNGNNAGSDYVAAWQHVYRIFADQAVANVAWVWCPYVESLYPWAPLENYYPGDAYVDWVAMDGYGYPTQSWAFDTSNTFDKTFSNTYAKLATFNKPMMIGELGCAEDVSNSAFKPGWITDAYSEMKTNYPLIKAITWFNYDKEYDWRVNSSDASLHAFKAVANFPYFSTQ